MATGKQILSKALDQRNWKRKVGPIKDAYGETDYKKKIIKIDKARHKKKNQPTGVKKNKDGSASITDTAVHESLHAKHPDWTEKKVRKVTPKKVKKMSKQAKALLVAKFK